MKITHLELTRFRSYRDISVPLNSPRVLFAGLNGSGKTSIREAIRWIVTGHCEGTDARGAGAEVLIPVGASDAQVSCQIEGIGRVTRTYHERAGGGFSVDAFTGTGQTQYQALCIKLNTTPAFLDAVLDTDVFLRLNHAEAKALVLALLDVKIPVVVEPRKTEDGIVEFTLDELDTKYKQYFEDRKAAKKLLAAHQIPEKPVGADMPTLEAIETQLAKLRSSLSDLHKAVGITVGRRATLIEESNRHLVVDVIEDRTDEIEKIRKQLDALSLVEAAPKKGDPQRLPFLKTRLDALKQHLPKSGCVIDAAVPCKTSQAAFDARIKELDAEVQALGSTPEIPDERTVLQKRLNALELEQQQRMKAIQALEAERVRKEAIQAELAALPQTDAEEQKIAVFNARITKGEELLRTARIYWQTLTAIETAQTRQKALQADVSRLEALCEQFGPKGARTATLKAAMGSFEAAVNPYLEPFGWQIGFTVEPWEVRANNRPVETYSTSERYRIGIALQLAIAQLSDLSFAVVDEIDMLDVHNRGVITAMLMQAPLEQILVMATREPSQGLPGASTQLLSYRLGRVEDNRTVIVESTAVESVPA